MTIFEPLRRGVDEVRDTLEEGWDWLRDRSASALTRFRRTRGDDDTAVLATHRGDSWGLLASDIVENDEDVVVRVEAPGLEEKDFSISVEAEQVVVRGEKLFEHEDRQAHYHLFESAYGVFERRFALPCAVDADRAEAKYRNGVLNIRLPRSEKSPRRRIRVKAA